MVELKVIENFIAMVESNRHVEAVELFYSPNVSIKDNQSESRGKDKQIENERKLLMNVREMHSKCVLPYFKKDNHVIIKWHFRFEFENETFIEIEEIVHQQWNESQIEKEQFFYDPKQLIPKLMSKL